MTMHGVWHLMERAIEFCNTLNSVKVMTAGIKRKDCIVMVTTMCGKRMAKATDFPLMRNGNTLPVRKQSKGYAFSGSDDVMEVAHFGAGVPCKVGIYNQ